MRSTPRATRAGTEPGDDRRRGPRPTETDTYPELQAGTLFGLP